MQLKQRAQNEEAGLAVFIQLTLGDLIHTPGFHFLS